MFSKSLLTAGLLMAAIVTGLLFSGCGGMPENAAATVDGKVISKDELDRRVILYYIFNSRQTRPDDPESKMYKLIRQEVLDQLVLEEVERQEAADRGITVSTEEIDVQEEQWLEDYYLSSITAMQEDFDRSGVTEADLRDEFYRILLEQKTMDSLKAEMTVTDDEARALYEANKGSYTYPETRQLRQVVVADEAAAQSVKSRIADGEDMGAIAREVSIDAATKPIGGRVDPVSKEKFPKSVGDAAFSLPLSQVSEPIQSDLGWYVIRVDVINPGSNVSFDQARDELVNNEIQRRMIGRYKNYAEEVKAKYDIEYAEGYAPE